jgi:putative transposase
LPSASRSSAISPSPTAFRKESGRLAVDDALRQEVGQALDEARAKVESIHGPLARQPFLVTDNGSSFIARRFAAYVREDFTHVRTQYRTPTQLALLQHFHQTLKRAEVDWRLYNDPQHARECLAELERRYNYDRPHWALVPEAGGDPLVPAEVYGEGRMTQLPKWRAWAREVKHRLDEMEVDPA